MRFVVTSVLVAAIGASTAAQDPMQQYEKLQAAMTAAQAKASRPGDVDLGCDGLQSELVASVNDPAVKSTAERLGAWSQEKQRELEAGTAAAKGRIAAQMAMGLASSLGSMFVPGFGMIAGQAQAAAQRAQAAQMAAEAQRNVAQIQEMSNAMIPILPQLMRGQHLMQLASAKKCEWAAGMQAGR